MLAHPEARSSTDFDMTQIFEPTTTADGHLDKARKTSEADCNMSKSDFDAHTKHMQIDIFSKKTIATHKAKIVCATCHAARNRGSRMRVFERCGRMHCAQCKPPETQCGAKGRAICSTEEQTGHMNAPQRTKKEERRKKKKEERRKKKEERRKKKEERRKKKEERRKKKEHEEHKTCASPAGNNGELSDNKNPAALDTLLRQIQERGPAPATMEKIPRTVRPRVTKS